MWWRQWRQQTRHLLLPLLPPQTPKKVRISRWLQSWLACGRWCCNSCSFWAETAARLWLRGASAQGGHRTHHGPLRAHTRMLHPRCMAHVQAPQQLLAKRRQMPPRPWQPSWRPTGISGWVSTACAAAARAQLWTAQQSRTHHLPLPPCPAHSRMERMPPGPAVGAQQQVFSLHHRHTHATLLPPRAALRAADALYSALDVLQQAACPPVAPAAAAGAPTASARPLQTSTTVSRPTSAHKQEPGEWVWAASSPLPFDAPGMQVLVVRRAACCMCLLQAVWAAWARHLC